MHPLPLHGACVCLQYEYLWADGVKYKKPVRLSAPEYVDKLFDWIEDQVRRCAVCLYSSRSWVTG